MNWVGITFILAAVSASCAESLKNEAASFTFDGFRLGDSYGAKVMSREPYDKPCDNDPIDKRSRRFMVYGAAPCRGLTFPEQTTVMFYLRFAEEGQPRYHQPIVAFAWLGGTYFNSRSNFPVKPGDSVGRAKELFGAAEATFSVTRKRHSLSVRRHKGNIFSIDDGEKLVGFVVGPMPDDPTNEQWRGLMQMWVRYTMPGAKG